MPATSRRADDQAERQIALQSVTQSTAFVCLRSLRVLRIVKLMRHLAWVPMLSAVLMKSRLPLAIMGFIFGIATLTLASMMYLAENAPGRYVLGRGRALPPPDNVADRPAAAYPAISSAYRRRCTSR